MLLVGCAIAFLVALAPRVVLILAAIFSDRWNVVWGGNWFWPLLGIIFLPYTTVMYMLVWSPTGISGFDWVWIILGVILDVMKWSQIANNRRGIPGYPGDSQAQMGATHYAEKELPPEDKPEPQAAAGPEETSAGTQPASDESSGEAGQAN